MIGENMGGSNKLEQGLGVNYTVLVIRNPPK